MDQPAPDKAVTEKMHRVGMKGERGQQSPPLPFTEDVVSITGALHEPRRLFVPGTGYGIKENERADEKQGWGLQQGSEVVIWCWAFRRPIFIFGKVAFKLMDCTEFFVSRDKKLPGVIFVEDFMRDLNRRQDKGPDGGGFLLICIKDGWVFWRDSFLKYHVGSDDSVETEEK